MLQERMSALYIILNYSSLVTHLIVDSKNVESLQHLDTHTQTRQTTENQEQDEYRTQQRK
jgi:hypothetical protein